MRKSGKEPLLGPDAKSQVTVAYEGGKAVRAPQIVVSTQHADGLTSADVRKIIEPYVIAALPTAGSTNAPSGTSTRPASS